MKNLILRLFLMGFASVFLSSCTLFQSFRYLKKESVKVINREIRGQEFIFVPVAHFGQKIFYEKLKDSISYWKNADYRIYYEQIETDPSIMKVDTLTAKTLKKKLRRINGGFGMTREDYQVFQKIFKNGISQPEWKDLGITASDLNADCNLKDYINQYESLYGLVDLSECDLEVPISQKYTCHPGLKNDLKPIMLDFRNRNVVDIVKTNKDKKIVLIYGALHIKPIIKLLKKS